MRLTHDPPWWARAISTPPASPMGWGFPSGGACCCGATPTGTYTTFCGNTPTALRDTDQYAIDTWTSQTDIPTPARYEQETASLNGAAYCFGGIGTVSPFFFVDNDEYVTDTWTAKADMPASRYDAGGMTIGDYCYSTGGYDSVGGATAAHYQYDPSGNSWATKTNLPTPARTTLGAAGIGSYGYAACGYSGGGLQDLDQYDPGGDSWTAKTSAPSPARSGLGFYALGSKGYATGGSSAGLGVDNDEYDPSGDSWTSKTDIPTPGRQWHGNEGDGSSVGYCTAGQGSGGSRIRDHDEYVVDAWTNRTDCPTPARQFNSSGYA